MPSLFQKARRVGIVTEPLALTAADAELVIIGRQLDARVRRLLGRSLHIRQVDAGSCNGCELEISALTNPYYDLERFGLHFVASPRHADCLLVTGPITRNMAGPLRETYEATPEPKIVVAVGDCARDGGLFCSAYGVVGGVDAILPVDALILGCPPSPHAILAGILRALDRLAERQRR